MIVYVAFRFNEVDESSQEAQDIRDEIAESLETMAIGFDASECWIQQGESA